MIFFILLLAAMFVALVAQFFIPPLPICGARVLLMPLIMFYGALALQVHRFEGIRPQGLLWLWDFEAVVRWTISSEVVVSAGENYMRHKIG